MHLFFDLFSQIRVKLFFIFIHSSCLLPFCFFLFHLPHPHDKSIYEQVFIYQISIANKLRFFFFFILLLNLLQILYRHYFDMIFHWITSIIHCYTWLLLFILTIINSHLLINKCQYEIIFICL
jgi:hypothetical protein